MHPRQLHLFQLDDLTQSRFLLVRIQHVVATFSFSPNLALFRSVVNSRISRILSRTMLEFDCSVCGGRSFLVIRNRPPVLGINNCWAHGSSRRIAAQFVQSSYPTALGNDHSSYCFLHEVHQKGLGLFVLSNPLLSLTSIPIRNRGIENWVLMHVV